MATLDRAEITRKVQEIIGETLRRDPSEIGLDDRLQEDLGAESLDIMTLVFELEDSFGQTLEDDDIRRLSTVGSVVDFLLDPGKMAAHA